MERDPFDRDQGGGSDVGRDFERDYGDEPAPAFRDAAPDALDPDEVRLLAQTLNRVALEIERDPARFFFGDRQKGFEAQ